MNPREAVNTAMVGFRRVAAARKKAEVYSNEPDLKEAVANIHKQ